MINIASFLCLFLAPQVEDKGIANCDMIVLNLVMDSDDEGLVKFAQLLYIDFGNPPRIDWIKAKPNKSPYIIKQWEIVNLQQVEDTILSIRKIDGFYYKYYPSEEIFIRSRHFIIERSLHDLEMEDRHNYKDYKVERELGVTPKRKKEYEENYLRSKPDSRPGTDTDLISPSILRR